MKNIYDYLSDIEDFSDGEKNFTNCLTCRLLAYLEYLSGGEDYEYMAMFAKSHTLYPLYCKHRIKKLTNVIFCL
jgi:hypothetical protein